MANIEFVNLKDVDKNLQLKVRSWRHANHVAKYFQIPNIDVETHKKRLKSLWNDNTRNVAFLIKVGDEFMRLTFFLNTDYKKKETDWGIYKENFRR